MKSYQGHRSWNSWNVALWIGNDEGLYNFALSCLRRGKSVLKATNLFLEDMQGQTTPDGANYNRACVREALASLKEEL